MRSTTTTLLLLGSCGHGKGIFWFEGPSWKKHTIQGDLRGTPATDSKTSQPR